MTEVTVMALLTTEDVLNKKFTPTKFREGYDQDEVDDFLDEVVETMGTLQNENAELKMKLNSAEQHVVAEQSAEVVPTPAPAVVEGNNEALEAANARIAELEAQLSQAQVAVEQANQQAQVAQGQISQLQTELAEAKSAAPVAAAVPEAPTSGPESATGLLALAQKMHDQYVEDGQAEGRRIIAEAHAKGEELMRQAEEDHQRNVARLDQERGLLENKVEELKAFERDYRSQLHEHLENLLRTVDAGSQE